MLSAWANNLSMLLTIPKGYRCVSYSEEKWIKECKSCKWMWKLRNGRIKFILWYKPLILGDNSRDVGDTLTVNRWYHCQPWWGQGNCSVLLSESKLNLLNYTSHYITQHHYHKTNIGPMGGNCLLFLCSCSWCQIAETNFHLLLPTLLLSTELLTAFLGCHHWTIFNTCTWHYLGYCW